MVIIQPKPPATHPFRVSVSDCLVSTTGFCGGLVFILSCMILGSKKDEIRGLSLSCKLHLCWLLSTSNSNFCPLHRRSDYTKTYNIGGKLLRPVSGYCDRGQRSSMFGKQLSTCQTGECTDEIFIRQSLFATCLGRVFVIALCKDEGKSSSIQMGLLRPAKQWAHIDRILSQVP